MPIPDGAARHQLRQGNFPVVPIVAATASGLDLALPFGCPGRGPALALRTNPFLPVSISVGAPLAGADGSTHHGAGRCLFHRSRNFAGIRSFASNVARHNLESFD